MLKVVLVKEKFSDAPWSTPESNLSADAFCSVCLIDANPSGKEKVKSLCHLPIKSKPGAPISKAALRNASARLNQVKGVSSQEKSKAKAKLERLKKQAGIGEK